jgi:hypothetical protein
VHAVRGDEPERLALTYKRAQAKSARAGTQLTVKLNASVYRSFRAGHTCCSLLWAAALGRMLTDARASQQKSELASFACDTTTDLVWRHGLLCKP